MRMREGQKVRRKNNLAGGPAFKYRGSKQYTVYSGITK